LNTIAEEASRLIGNTFESHFILALNNPLSRTGFEHLRMANALQPENAMTFGELIQMYEFLKDETTRKVFSEKLFSTGLVAQSLLNYSYNVLMSVEENAILFTDSDNTTLPMYLLQDVIGVRKDVTVLNLDMLIQDEYRSVKLPSINLKLSNYISSSRQELCTLLPEQNPERVFYYALTLSKENILSIKDQLYVVGLASQHSTRNIDNIATIKNNLENRFLLDYLTVDFNGENEFSAGSVLNANYLVPMLLLLEHYRKSGEDSKSKELEIRILQIAKKSGKTLLVENFLHRKENEEQPFIPYRIPAKELEGQFKFVKDNIYAHEYEVTNRQYNEFIQYLLKNNLRELYEICKIQLSQYEEPALSFMTGYHSNRQPTKKEKYFLMYPVINITYEAAQEYCKWLTDQYNNTAERKYKKVKFRLPSIEEWQIAAAALKNAKSWRLDENTAEVKVFEDGKDVSKKYEKRTVSMSDPEIQYPWFRYWGLRKTVLNSRGCSLGNFKFPESQKPCVLNKMNTADGFLLMSPVQSYFPNDIGLYDVVGNVAEMTIEKGRACGGSWNHSPEESTIRSVSEYTQANSEVGFRIFMEVLEP
jgi:formylglycine-generating enzyme required for sulfatase activity